MHKKRSFVSIVLFIEDFFSPLAFCSLTGEKPQRRVKYFLCQTARCSCVLNFSTGSFTSQLKPEMVLLPALCSDSRGETFELIVFCRWLDWQVTQDWLLVFSLRPVSTAILHLAAVFMVLFNPRYYQLLWLIVDRLKLLVKIPAETGLHSRTLKTHSCKIRRADFFVFLLVAYSFFVWYVMHLACRLSLWFCHFICWKQKGQPSKLAKSRKLITTPSKQFSVISSVIKILWQKLHTLVILKVALPLITISLGENCQQWLHCEMFL